MVQIANLVLGLEFKDLLVEVTEVEGVDPESKPEDPAHSAIVGDATGHIRLVYRAATAVRSTQVKKGKTYLVAGKVTTHNGHVQIQIGSSWGKISLINGQKVLHIPPYCEATDLSAPERRYGSVLLRCGPAEQLQAFVCSSGEALPSLTCSFLETDRITACRALEGGLEMLPNGFRLLPVVPVECYERAAEGIVITSIFAAVETNPADRFSIGALGQWQPMSDLLKQVRDALRRSLRALLLQLAQASSVGLIDLKVAESTLGMREALAMSQEQAGDAHDDSHASSASYATEDEEYWGEIAASGSTVGSAGAATHDDGHPTGQAARQPAGQPDHLEEPASPSGQTRNNPATDGKTIAGSTKQYLEWQPGQLHKVTSGGAEVQSLLDRMEANRGVAVVAWFAGWAESCRASIPALERLAAERVDVPFLLLDVEASATNRALAMEKALTKPQSQRRTAKPVLRGEQKFPAFSLHIAPALQPQQMFTGPSALKDLAKCVADCPANAYLAPVPAPEPCVEGANAASVAAAAAASSEAATKPAADRARGGTGKQMGLGMIKRGAPDLKQKLQDAQAAEEAMVVLWTAASAEPACGPALQALQSMAPSCPGTAIYEAPSDMSKANGLLAEALGVSAVPTLQVFRDIKVQNSFPECTAERIRSVLGRLAHGEGTSAAQEAPDRPTRAEHVPSEAADSAMQDPPEPSLPAVSRATSGSAAQRPQSDSAANSREPSSAGKSPEASEQDDARFAPLAGKDAVSGAQRMMPGCKKGYFWPKMPCLRCGCPWYSGEDWDALCLRCGWDCQVSGYNDESQPLPPFRAQWQEFTAAIRDGRTPAYDGRRAKASSKT